jgi:hypothetical protein
MNARFTFPVCFFAVLLLFSCASLRAQGNIDWELLWINVPTAPTSPSHHTGWMQPSCSFTGLAYDRWRDVVYVVNPAVDAQGKAEPRIHVWDAATGQPALNMGRSAHPSNAGQGAELPVPLDTLAPASGQRFGFDRNRFSLFRIDLDDDGRIWACNLVSPLWGICILLPSSQCDPRYLNQGPFRVWRWDTPTSTPLLAYATLNSTAAAIGSIQSSEQAYTRWGDAFDVIGKRSLYDPQDGNPPYEVDSVRIYSSGGSFPLQSEWNREVNVILADTRPPGQRADRDTPGGGKLDLRLAVKLSNTNSGLAAHGVAATATSLTHDVWMDSNPGLTTAAQHVQHPTNPWPQTYQQSSVSNRSISTTLTGPSGTLKYFELPQHGRKFLVFADGTPTGGMDTSIANNNTTARVLDVTSPGNVFIAFGSTPRIGNKRLDITDAMNNYISDVDYGFRFYSEQEAPDNPGTYLILYVLMSNNGIAAFRSRRSIDPIPIELTSFRATSIDGRVELRWDVAMELNNHGFEIQRSFDGGARWDVLGFVSGQGTTTQPSRYTYTDALSESHRHLRRVLYRLRQIDHDGSDWLSPVAEALIDALPTKITLYQNYPNPFNPVTTISYALGEDSHVTLEVLNALGERVALLTDEFKSAGTHSIGMNASQLPAGVYLYRLSANGVSVQKKMTVMK